MTKDFPYSSVGKESPCNAGDLGSILGSERSPGEGNGNRFQYSCFLPGESQGQRSLAGYSPWGHKSRTRLSGYTTNTMCGRLRNGEKKRCLFFPPPWEFQTSFSSSLGTPDFLSTYLGIDSLTTMMLRASWYENRHQPWSPHQLHQGAANSPGAPVSLSCLTTPFYTWKPFLPHFHPQPGPLPGVNESRLHQMETVNKPDLWFLILRAPSRP